MNCVIEQFIQNNLDAIFITNNTPDHIAFNRVESRMAPLSKELAGLILLHDNSGLHLDCQVRTVDVDLERQTFCHAEKVFWQRYGQIPSLMAIQS